MNRRAGTLALIENRLDHLDRAMDDMEDVLGNVVTRDTAVRRRARHPWLDQTSVRFCRQVLDALECFPEVLPDTLSVNDVRRIMEAELGAVERLMRRRDRLNGLVEQADLALAVTGGELMDTAVEVYALLASSDRARDIIALPGIPDR